ncbi:unnamed protein product [Penicillium olsonii]|uniref:Uncharacterized protein n=1 Tax=Penicillium olsonii TaxID=99116 RepID=A0A9W4HYG6_PENOL|nr:unnamed protein product [Penicillium olsonii]CAG8161650.1 unnamed protein product [Penicillium olsonii]
MCFSATRPLRVAGLTVPNPRCRPVATPTQTWSIRRCVQSRSNNDRKQIPRSGKRQRYPGSSRETVWWYEWSLFSWKYPNRKLDFWLDRSGSFDVNGQGSHGNADSPKLIQSLKKLIAADAYRRKDIFHGLGRGDTLWNGYPQSFSKAPQSTKARAPEPTQQTSTSNHIGRHYDPISGRMRPGLPTRFDDSDRIVFHPWKEVDSSRANGMKGAATDVDSTETQHQSGTLGSRTETHLNPQPILTDPPGSEIGAVSNSNSLAQGPRIETEELVEPASRSQPNIDCPPGHESNSMPTLESTKPVESPTNVFEHGSKSSTEANPIVDSIPATIECPPGNEIEAKLTADPVSCSDESLPSELNAQQPDEISPMNVNCPPGNELEAKFTAEIAHQDTQANELFQPSTDPISQACLPESVDCSPGNEIEAHILSKSTEIDKGQSNDKRPIDCPPGSEIEANFSANPPPAYDGHSAPPDLASLDISKNTHVNVDCPPGNELEAKLITDLTKSTQSSTKTDIDSLGVHDAKVHPCQPSLGYSEDRVGDFVAQHQALTSETVQPSALHQPFPEFYIIALDPMTSQIITETADSSLEIKEDTIPSEIISRLYNSAKFLPHLEKRHAEVYKIVAGGGDILVFQKNPSDLPFSETAEPDSAIHAETAQHQHDSKGPSLSTPNASGEPPEPHPAAKSSLEPEPLTKSGPASRGVIRRMIFAGVATAATCYAIGEVTEFFRTGGKDGRGADGFTVFESDRRHRE